MNNTYHFIIFIASLTRFMEVIIFTNGTSAIVVYPYDKHSFYRHGYVYFRNETVIPLKLILNDFSCRLIIDD